MESIVHVGSDVCYERIVFLWAWSVLARSRPNFKFEWKSSSLYLYRRPTRCCYRQLYERWRWPFCLVVVYLWVPTPPLTKYDWVSAVCHCRILAVYFCFGHALLLYNFLVDGWLLVSIVLRQLLCTRCSFFVSFWSKMASQMMWMLWFAAHSTLRWINDKKEGEKLDLEWDCNTPNLFPEFVYFVAHAFLTFSTREFVRLWHGA